MRIAYKAAIGLLIWAPAASAQLPDRYRLPAEITYPEGIALDPDAGAIYVASSPSGQIARVDTRTGRSQLIGNGLAREIGGVFPGILGLRLDAQGRLWMAGGRTGKVFVVDAKTGALIQTITPPDASTGLINDIAFAGERPSSRIRCGPRCGRWTSEPASRPRPSRGSTSQAPRWRMARVRTSTASLRRRTGAHCSPDR